MRKYFFTTLFLIIFLSNYFSVFAQTENELPDIILFHGEECPHCKAERTFLDGLKKELPELEVIEYEVWHNEENRKIFLEIAESLGIENLGVPLTIIGDKYLIGFDKPENSGKEIKKMLGLETDGDSSIFSHPIFGKINIKNLSLPFLAVVLGTLDGFNPCSMWALLVLLTLLIATGSRRKVWIVGGVFILTSAFSYFLFMAAWLNTFIFIGYINAVQIIIGILALVAGIVSIREFFTFKPGVCEITDEKKKTKLTERIKNILHSHSLLFMVLGVMGIAFSVNLIELLCSLGIPVIYTKALAMHSLAKWKYYAYIGLYDFFYMLDDIIILLIAGFSMKFFHFNTRYSRYSRLIAGILMVILGLIFLIKPELLIFG